MAAVLKRFSGSITWHFSRVVKSEANVYTFNRIKAEPFKLLERKSTRNFSGISFEKSLQLPWLSQGDCRCIPKRGYFNMVLNSRNSFRIAKYDRINLQQVRYMPTLNQIRRLKPRTKKKKPKKELPRDKRILLGPQRKGVCVKLVVRTPKKPNSAQRKCAVLRLSNGKLITAYIPGEKGALQEHGVVLFEGGRVQDCPGIKYKIIRRKYDMN